MWGALAKGAMKVGRGASMAKNVFKGKGRKYVDASQQTVDVEASPAVSKPTTPLISSSSTFNAKSISKPTAAIGKEDLVGTAFRIKTTLVDVDTLLKGSIALDEIREKDRKKGGKKKERKGSEKELESATKKNKNKFKLRGLVPPKAKSVFGSIINFFVTLLLGKVLFALIDNVGLLEGIAKGLVGVSNFLLKWGGKLLNAFVGLIDFGYKIYDGLRGTVGNLFGESGMKVFDNLSKTFVLLLNTALIAAMAGSQINQGLDIVRGRRFGKTSKDVIRRYARRFGDKAARRKFGTEAVKTAGKKFARSGLTRVARAGVSKVLGRGGSKVLLRLTKNFVSPVIKRIPLIGGLIDFALNVFVFKEPPGKAAFKAIGAGLGAWLLGALGSIVPGLGTFIGAVAGGFVGDALGGLIYDLVFGKKSTSDLKREATDGEEEQKDKNLSQTAISGAVTAKPVRQAAMGATKKVAKIATKKATKIGLRTIGKGATKQVLKSSKNILKAAKKIISPIVKRIPFLGPLIDFLLNAFVFKEPLGRSAFMAIGAGVGAWLGGLLGTLAGPAGTIVGAFLGGAGGDMLGGAIYDSIFSGKDSEKKGETGETGDTVSKVSSSSGSGSGGIEGKTEDMSEGIDTYAGYEEEDSTTYVITQKSSPSASEGTDGNKTNETALKMTEGMMLASSLRESAPSVYAELAKR
jgi:hypothetical protein